MKFISNALLCIASSVFTGTIGSLIVNRIERYMQRRAKEKSSTPPG